MQKSSRFGLGANEQNMMLNVERLTKFSKTSIQITNFQAQLNEQQAVPLNHTPLS